MTSLETIRSLMEHLFWADERVVEAVARADEAEWDEPGGDGGPGDVTGGGEAGDEASGDPPPAGDAAAAAVREMAHVLGAEEVWLARLQRRQRQAPVWPDLEPHVPDDRAAGLARLMDDGHARLRSFVESLDETDLTRTVEYTNSAGRAFTNTVGEILVHVALHGQYHRGKVNLMLRRGGLEPAPADYIAMVRGAAAATREDARQAGAGSWSGEDGRDVRTRASEPSGDDRP